MAELPTPRSITIATIISLYSDPNSPLVTTTHSNDDLNDDYDCRWDLHLSNLIYQLVMKEDEGSIILPNGSIHDIAQKNDDWSSNPAEDEVIDDQIHVLLNQKSCRLSHISEEVTFMDDFLFKETFGCSRYQDHFSHEFKRVKDRERSEITNTVILMKTQSLSDVLDRIDSAFLSFIHRKKSRCEYENDKENSFIGCRTPPSLVILSKLQDASQSIEHLMNLLDEWHSLLEGTHIGYPAYNSETVPKVSNAANRNAISIDGDSSFGIYLRKLCLGMEEIPFEAMSRLWRSLRDDIWDELAKKESLDCKQDSSNEVVTNIGGNNWLPSTSQIERIVRKTCFEPHLESLLRQHERRSLDMQHSSLDNSSQQRRSPIHNLLQTHPECPSLHFLLFLSSVTNGERSRALESLHRYFDYAMIHERKDRAERAMVLHTARGINLGGGGGGPSIEGSVTGMGGITTAATTTSSNSGVTSNIITAQGRNQSPLGNKVKESNVMQYAAILLAQMYHRFGYSELSLQAIEEAIRVAQQSGDIDCVTFAQAWLAFASTFGGIKEGSVYARVGGIMINMTSDRPLVSSPCWRHSSTQDEAIIILQRCQNKAVDRGLSSLATGVSLDLVRRQVYHHLGVGAGELTLDSNEELISSLSSLAWENTQGVGRRYKIGSSSMGSRCGLMVNQHGSAFRGGQSFIDNLAVDTLNALGRRCIAISGLWDSTGHSSLASLSSFAALYGFGTKLGSSASVAMRRVLTSLSFGPGVNAWRMRNSFQVKDEQCTDSVYDMSLKLSLLCGEGPSSEWIQFATSMLSEWSVRSFDLSVAQGLQCILANHAAFPSGFHLAIERNVVSLSQLTHLYLQRKDFERARAVARRNCWLTNKHSLLIHQCWQLLQLAIISIEASISVPSVNPTVECSLGPLLECLYLSEKYSMDPLRAMSLVMLSKFLLYIGHFRRARAMLSAVIPSVMQNSHIWFQAEACLTLAKCYLAEASCLERKTLCNLEVGSGKKKKLLSKSNQTLDDLHHTASTQLNIAQCLYEQIQDINGLRQVYYLQARVYNSLKMMQSRDAAARMFIQESEKRLRGILSATMLEGSSKRQYFSPKSMCGLYNAGGSTNVSLQ